MTKQYSGLLLVSVLVIGLIIGVLVGVIVGSRTHIVGTPSGQTESKSSTSLVSSSTPSLATFQAVLENSTKARLSVPEYDFGKGTLSMWVTNTGASPVVLSTLDFLYNGSYIEGTYFNVLDPTVTQLGIYAYIPPSSQIIVEITPPVTPLTGQNATVKVLNDTFTFTYGTSRA